MGDGEGLREKPLRVDFYVIEGTSAASRLKVACRLAEKAYLASQRALIWHTERAELEALDTLLWTFADGSFVPHDWLTSNAAAETPVLLSAGDAVPLTIHDGRAPGPDVVSGRSSVTRPVPGLAPSGLPGADTPDVADRSGRSARDSPMADFDFVVNLAADPPPFLHLTRRVAEIIDGDEGRRRAGRARFKAYRELGIEPATHTLRAE